MSVFVALLLRYNLFLRIIRIYTIQIYIYIRDKVCSCFHFLVCASWLEWMLLSHHMFWMHSFWRRILCWLFSCGCEVVVMAVVKQLPRPTFTLALSLTRNSIANIPFYPHHISAAHVLKEFNACCVLYIQDKANTMAMNVFGVNFAWLIIAHAYTWKICKHITCRNLPWFTIYQMLMFTFRKIKTGKHIYYTSYEG